MLATMIDTPVRLPAHGAFRGVRLALLAPFLATPLWAQDWETSADRPGDPAIHQPDYPLVFVATKGHGDEASGTPPHFGLDVHAASNPSAQGAGGGLYVLLPDGRVEKLFPLAVHESVAGLIDTPLGELWRGAVAEPNVSEDGRALTFAWFHDATWEPAGGGFTSRKLSYKGCDLYRLDLGPLVDDPDVDPASLGIRRLTFKQYDGPAKSDVLQSAADRFRDARNPGLAQAASEANYWGTMDLHLIEMRTRSGPRALWVSNRARLMNSNDGFGDANHHFELYSAEVLPDGSLGPASPFQHYTTTSALSPTPLRNGLAFSYQSSTEEGRRWEIQSLDSEGRWNPLIGYAHSSELFHLGTLVVERGPEGELVDSFVAAKYYNENNGGFGQLHVLRMEDAGINELVLGPWGRSPRQLSRLLTLGAVATDIPSPQVTVGGQPVYVGKFSSPRAGRVGGEYFMAYTPTSANVARLDADGRRNRFESEIRYRPDLTSFEAHEPIDVATGRGLWAVVRDATLEYDLIWPTPVLSWLERTGEAEQRVAEPIVDPASPVPPGMPFAEIGTSALWNTDIRPYDCTLRDSRPLNPNDLDSNEVVQVLHSQEGLRFVQDPSDPCQPLAPETVLGVGVNLTSQRTDFRYFNARGYETDGSGKIESVEQIGFYSVLEQNESDQSFKVRIPADVPFELHLVDRRYGMKLADVRSWHSLKPRETRTDCGGCHQHEAGLQIPFEGREASRKPAFDLTQLTTFLDYDADCRPVIGTAATPVLPTPEWKADVWPGFDQHCGACHDVVRSTDTAALLALDFGTEEDAYDKLKARHYADSELGALGSPAFWAAYGERTDGRDNDFPGYAPDYAAGEWGYRFSSLHATSPGLCAASDPEWAGWVRTFGQWIDNHMPRDTGASAFVYGFDRYPPTVDFALSPDLRRMEVGVWDDRGSVALTLERNGGALASLPALANGSTPVDLPSGLALTDRIRAVAQDPAGNRLVREKSVEDLLRERGFRTQQRSRTLGNTPPDVQVSLSLAGSKHAPGVPLVLAARAKDREDGDLGAELVWLSDRDGLLGGGPALVAALEAPGPHRITAWVADSEGKVGSAFADVTVTAPDAAPVVTILAPAPQATFAVGESILFAAHATDAEDDDGALSASIAWSSDRDGPIGTGAAFRTATLSSGVHTVTAAVTDSGGASAFDQVVLLVADPELPLAGLVLRLESTQGVSGGAGSVLAWADLSGRGNHLSARGAPALAPALTPSGLPAIVLDGQDDGLERVHAQAPLAGLPAGNADRSLFLVARYNGLSWSAGVAYGAPASNAAFGPGVRHPGGALMLQGFGYENDLESSAPGVGAGWLLQGAILSSGTATLFSGETPVAQWSHAYGTVLSRFVLGQEIGGFGAVAMDVAAVLVYDRALSTAERQAVHAYLSRTYLEVPLPNDPPLLDIETPVDGSTFVAGESVPLRATATDPQDGDLSSQIVWTSDRDGALGIGAVLAPALSPGVHAVTARVVDGEGAEATASVALVVLEHEPVAPTAPIALFDGLTLDGLQPWFASSGFGDPDAVFRVEDGLLRVTGSDRGALATIESYRDYALVLEFRWGEDTWPPRQGLARNAGLFVHAFGSEGDWNGLVLPGLQAQILEGGTGDLLLLDGPSMSMTASALASQVACTFDTWNCREGFRWDPAGTLLELGSVPFGTLHWRSWDPDWQDLLGFRGDDDVDSPHGDWNQLVVVAAGDGVEVFLNGVKVNEAFAVRPSAGRIQLESEFAELFVRRWELLPLGTPVGPTLASSGLPHGIAGSSYAGALAAVAGTSPVTWSVSGGALPPGLALDPVTGAITGVPDAAGSTPFLARVTDALGHSAEAPFTLEVVPPPSGLPTAGLVLQLESTESTSAAPVTSWSDQSGRGNHVFAAGDPAVVLDATPSGRPAIVLAGLNDKLQRLHATQPLSGLPVGNGDRSMFLVARYDASAASAGASYGRAASNQAFGLMIRHPAGSLALQGYGFEHDLVSSAPGTGAGWLVQSTVVGAGQARLFAGGTQVAQWSHAYDTGLERLVIGQEIGALGYVDMQVAALLVYDRALSEPERLAVEAYLRGKYLDAP